jgi:hypothetical protein
MTPSFSVDNLRKSRRVELEDTDGGERLRLLENQYRFRLIKPNKGTAYKKYLIEIEDIIESYCNGGTWCMQMLDNDNGFMEMRLLFSHQEVADRVYKKLLMELLKGKGNGK